MRLRLKQGNKDTYVVDQSNTFDMHMLSIERVLKKFDDIIANGVLCGEALGPC